LVTLVAKPERSRQFEQSYFHVRVLKTWRIARPIASPSLRTGFAAAGPAPHGTGRPPMTAAKMRGEDS
jgi:hypothetical protein